MEKSGDIDENGDKKTDKQNMDAIINDMFGTSGPPEPDMLLEILESNPSGSGDDPLY